MIGATSNAAPPWPASIDGGGDRPADGGYDWREAVPEPSHAYLDPVVLRALVDWQRRAASPRGRVRVFDAGCGNGALLRTLYGRHYDVAGCELSSTGVALARETLGSRVRIEQMSVYDDLAAVFGLGWDVVVATEVIEHLFAPRLFVRRALALLAPGGALLLTTPYHGYLKNVALAVTGSLDRHFTALWDGGHIKFWSYATLTALLREAGFGHFRFYGAGRIPGLWKSMVVLATVQPNVGEAA
jgi:2-polyprenyl-6-hydroxyphenyl methylase/3-demethylubiquinone-9 3-methyltransferase